MTRVLYINFPLPLSLPLTHHILTALRVTLVAVSLTSSLFVLPTMFLEMGPTTISFETGAEPSRRQCVL
jgi:hypothetical protein